LHDAGPGGGAGRAAVAVRPVRPARDLDADSGAIAGGPPVSGPVRHVAITADDFGLDRAVNAAIIHLGRSDRLHRASVLIDAPHAGDALAADLPIALGLHVDLPAAMLATATSTQIRTEMSRQWQQMVR